MIPAILYFSWLFRFFRNSNDFSRSFCCFRRVGWDMGPRFPKKFRQSTEKCGSKAESKR